MTAHDPKNGVRAHDSNPPSVRPSGKLSYVNIDKTGLSMSWKTAIGLIVAIGTLLLGWIAFVQKLATADDINGHNLDQAAHPIEVKDEDGDKVVKSLPSCVKEQVVVQRSVSRKISSVESTVKDNRKGIIIVKNGFYEDRAERLADRAADKVQGRIRSRERWKYVKEKALDNLRNGKPAREGLEDYL